MMILGNPRVSARGMVAFGIAAALALSCSGEAPSTSSAASPHTVVVGTFDPTDTTIPRLHDVVALPGAEMAWFAAAEIPIVERTVDAQGRAVFTIMASGDLAASFAQHGFLVQGHTYVVPSVSPGGRPIVPFSETMCAASATWSPTSQYFAWYDAYPGAFNGGIDKELQSMAAPHVAVKSIAMTEGKRNVWAVSVGPLAETTGAVPTVYVIGTHHAREWASEEVTLELLRYYVKGVASGDKTIVTQLAHAAIVFVPVANPDGYQYTHAPAIGGSGNRSQRKNRRSTACPSGVNASTQGVDLNRNYDLTWGAPADSMDAVSTCSDVYIGPSAASEPEVQGLEKLLVGAVFPNANGTAQKPVVSISYHTYSDDLLYPGGFKAKTDANGPRCLPEDNCVNPDLVLYRHLFGDYENAVMVDTTLMPNLNVPTGMENTIGYTTSGDTTAFAQNASAPSLSVTPELTSKTVGFYIECEANYTTIIAAWVKNQKLLLAGALNAATSLASVTPSTSYGPPIFSAGFAMTGWGRETSEGFDAQTARARLVIGHFRATDTYAPFTINVDGVAATAVPGRRGVQYDAFLYDPPDPLVLPCTVTGGKQAPESGTKGGCTKPIDLCDPNRLPHDPAWKLVSGLRGGKKDCWWEADASVGGVLGIPSYSGFPANTTQCELMFTTYWDANAATNPVVLERFHGGAWSEVTRWPYAAPPIYETRTFVSGQRLRSEVVESNATVPGPTDAFQFVLKAGGQPKFQLFDPVVYCRYGSRP